MDARLLKEERLLRLNQIIGQEEVSQEEAQANKAKAAAIRKEFPVSDPDPKVEKKKKKELARKLAKVGPKTRQRMIKPIIPTGKSAWWAGVASGKYPKPIRLGRITCWRESLVLDLMESETKA